MRERLHGAPWIGIVGAVLVVVGAGLLATGVLPSDAAIEIGERTWPVLLFVVAATIVAELAAVAGVFHAIAERLGTIGAGRAWVVWLLVVALATVATIMLSLDTTAVLLTPVVVLLARHLRLDPLPFALTTVWLANTGSLLLPVSNLTNLLAEHRLDLGPGAFAALMAPAAIVGIAVPVVAVALVHRRSLAVRFERQTVEAEPDRVLTIGAGVVVALLVPALVSGIEVWIPASVAAALLLVLVAVRRRSAVRWSLVPWQIVLLAVGLFLVVETLHARGLAAALAPVVGTGDGLGDLLRLAGSGALLANGVDNLPAYLALEPLATDPQRMAALLVGVNAGALVTPWASLAILLWHDRLAAMGVTLAWGRYMLLSVVVAPVTVVLAVLALWFAHVA
ncbi:SLC13 family permease [Agrococcus sp. SGAir0287]|uniref:SLC13 family permease n=1 Tax=Agrococcus sp. SGAir0287 TaxID=2070347 RepID=UPI0010CD297A|nr:SLC13 family permease [Agrococcus sp. SGAir0287]QCR20750.1 arsenic transporter [Agrococcus sp. SGAir0287]